jgi:tRNA1(Val) A37 N6-methylase TrmN6
MNFKINETEQKLRGGYYTPLDLAMYISTWATEHRPRTVLEPSCGDGIFVEALSKLNPESNLAFTGFELLEAEAAKARKRCRLSNFASTVHNQDFLDFAISQILSGQTNFDCVIGNPPFIRYQYLPEESQQKAAAVFKLLRLPFTKHTNAWVPFVLACVAMLRPGGRLGMILPSEIIHVMHPQSLRTYLGQTCSRILVIDPEEIWFEGTLQGAVILFAEKKLRADDHCDGVGIIRVTGRSFLSDSPRAGGPPFHFFFPIRYIGCPVLALFARAGCDADCTMVLYAPRPASHLRCASSALYHLFLLPSNALFPFPAKPRPLPLHS